MRAAVATGSSTRIGRASALALAPRGARLRPRRGQRVHDGAGIKSQLRRLLPDRVLDGLVARELRR